MDFRGFSPWLKGSKAEAAWWEALAGRKQQPGSRERRGETDKSVPFQVTLPPPVGPNST